MTENGTEKYVSTYLENPKHTLVSKFGPIYTSMSSIMRGVPPGRRVNCLRKEEVLRFPMRAFGLLRMGMTQILFAEKKFSAFLGQPSIFCLQFRM